MDVAGERQILEQLSAPHPRPTIVIIAHRAESLALCDRVIRIENGRGVDDQGSVPIASIGRIRAVD